MKRWQKVGLIALGIVLVLASLIYLRRDQFRKWFWQPTASEVEVGLSEVPDENKPDQEVVAEGLNIPWEVMKLPDGDLLVTERSGTIRRIGQNKKVYTISGVTHVGEGGLLGMALHPDFKNSSYIYLYFSAQGGGVITNQIERYKYTKDTLINRQLILGNIPGSSNHDGGRIAFGPDKLFYVTTGDASNTAFAQNTSSLAGKILRMTDSGKVPSGNPFNNLVYSYGHRNPQGLAWDDQGRLWSTEHGRSGLQSGYDELNLIEKGANYGWPLIQGDESRSGMKSPIKHSGANDTWAPASLTFYKGSLFFAGLRGQTLYQAKLGNGTSVSLKAHLKSKYGRLRTVTMLGGEMYLTTSNRDGRGDPKPGDDKLIRFNPEIFK